MALAGEYKATSQKIARCWGDGDPLMEAYHDSEWGRPVHDDQTLFEFLLLDNFQAGLSWRTILHKRENFRAAFAAFDPVKVAAFTDRDKQRLLADAGIIRNRAKVNCALTNAREYLRIQQEFGSFDTYIWRFTNGRVIRHSGMDTWEQLPVSTPEAEALSAGLRSRGFKFVGPTICYAYMQSIGLMYDHLTGCFLYHI